MVFTVACGFDLLGLYFHVSFCIFRLSIKNKFVFILLVCVLWFHPNSGEFVSFLLSFITFFFYSNHYRSVIMFILGFVSVFLSFSYRAFMLYHLHLLMFFTIKYISVHPLIVSLHHLKSPLLIPYHLLSSSPDLVLTCLNTSFLLHSHSTLHSYPVQNSPYFNVSSLNICILNF